MKSFELAVKEGKSMGIMSSHNRIGTTWASADYNLLKNVLRDEWNFTGCISVDYLGSPRYQSPLDAVLGGADKMLCNNTSFDDIKPHSDNPYVMTQVRQACKNILYTHANSSAMNGASPLDYVKSARPVWQSALIAANVVLPLIATGLLALIVVDIVKVKKANKKQ